MTFNPYAPYGPLASSTIRVVTWNVWGRYGADCDARQAALEQTLEETAPDLVCLVEAWRQGDSTQPGRVAARLGLAHHRFVGDWEQEDWVSGIGFVSRWPMTEPRCRPLRAEDGSGFGEAVPPSASTPTGALTTSFPHGHGAAVSATRHAVRCSASAHQGSSSCPTTTG